MLSSFSLPSPLRGRRKENNPVNCFLTTGAELLICDPATATEANVTVAADRSKLVLPFLQHLRSQTGQGEGDNQPSMYSPPKILGGVRGGFIHPQIKPRPIFRLNLKLTIYNNQTFCYY